MSTLKVNTIQDTTGNDALTIDSSGNVTASQGFVPSTQLSHRNLIINGAMTVSQRGDFTSASSMSNGTYYLDRYYTQIGGSGVAANKQHTSVTLPDGTSAKAYKVTATSGGTGYMGIMQIIEDYAILSNRTITLSCWVRTNMDNVRFRHSSTEDYAPKAPATGEWHYLTHTVKLGSITSAGVGANQTGFMVLCYDESSVSVSSGDYIEFTHFQIELGSVATPFEHRSFAEELARCQRYYYRYIDGNSQYIGIGHWWTAGAIDTGVTFPVAMRSSPTLVATNGSNYYYMLTAGNARYISNSWNINRATKNATQLWVSPDVGDTAGRGGMVTSTNASASIAFDAEL